ncbi:MAG: hypothetical protein PHV02_02095 [Rhodocyclaceae bacterium]|nr:hypothetical protein [Rhodocyclaceae bacterium]
MLNNQERRVRIEQRQRDIGPPMACAERRKKAERRLPIIGEAVMSDEDWQLYFGNHDKPGLANDAGAEHAAAIFDRARDGF